LEYVKMPQLGEFMKEGTIGAWLKREGDEVKEGDPLFELETEKFVEVIKARSSGILRKILVPEGATVPVGEKLAIIAKPGEEITEVPIERKERPIEKVRASPRAKKLAEEYGIDLSLITGTGPGGLIVEKDVKRLIKGEYPKIKEVIPLTEIKKTMSKRMIQSVQTAAHCTITMDADMSNCIRLREELTSKTKVSYTSMFVKAAAKALEEYPIINSTVEGDKIKIFDDINIGVAVDTERGLVVPVVRSANKKSLEEISHEIDELAKNARKGMPSRKELTGGTFTITNLGMFGVEIFTPIINPPQNAILGVGKITEKPKVINGKLEIRPIVYLSLSFDHRVIEGALAARFLQELKKNLENPRLLLE